MNQLPTYQSASISRLAPTYGSACCLAGVTLGGRGTTHYYLCAKCRKPCDAVLVGRCPECRRKTKHEINGVGMWICQRCKLDVTPNNRIT
jgi:hypothetical protein